MAELEQKPTITMSVTLSLTEEEARALNALTLYRDESFLNFFYANLGRRDLEKHEEGLRSLFKSVRAILPTLLGRTDYAREVFTEGKKKP